MYQEEGLGWGAGGADDQLVKIAGQAREGRGGKSPERCEGDAEEPTKKSRKRKSHSQWSPMRRLELPIKEEL